MSSLSMPAAFSVVDQLAHVGGVGVERLLGGGALRGDAGGDVGGVGRRHDLAVAGQLHRCRRRRRARRGPSRGSRGSRAVKRRIGVSLCRPGEHAGQCGYDYDAGRDTILGKISTKVGGTCLGRLLDRARAGGLGSAARRGTNMSDTIVPTDGVLLGRAKVPGFAYPARRDGARRPASSTSPPKARRRCAISASTTIRRPMWQRAKAPISARSTRSLANSWAGHQSDSAPSLLSPIDLQAVKAAGVTFVVSLLERVIEEQARGDKAQGRCAARRDHRADRHRSQPSSCRARRRP